MANGWPLRRLLLIILMMLAIAGIYGNLRWLAVQAYIRFSENRGQAPETRVVARQAAALALRLQPSSAGAMQAQAANDLFLGQQDLALNEYRRALLRAPADAFLWRDYALALVYAGRYDQDLENAVYQAQSWALQSRPVHLALAVAGLKVYTRSDENLRRLWMRSIKVAYVLSPDAVLWAAYVSEQELLLCNGDVILKPESNVWCAAARWRHGLCSEPTPGTSGCFGRHAP